ncbi:MAG: 4-hydroxy-tetrahydrodipicolinate reductase [Candidatus Desulfofervidus auxilii]|nr:4-hydroxy-tetrahydrodipicolinate reductase [Candidatus Desulfofervidus auxilii]
MIKTIVAGICGRMGSTIARLVYADKDMELCGGFERSDHPKIGADIGEVIGIGQLGIKIVENLEEIIEKADVIIDFTFHTASLNHLKIAKQYNKPIVIGTTGFTQQEIEEMKKMADEVKCVLSPNMSVGVNLLFKVVPQIATILGEDYDIEIVEMHHRMKKDAPSGTAVKLAQLIAQAMNRDLDKVGVYGRKGIVGERKSEEIGVLALRGGDVVGEHTIYFAGLGERIEVTHRASSRETFARGALRAAKWIVKQRENGIYDMLDVLGLK